MEACMRKLKVLWFSVSVYFFFFLVCIRNMRLI